MEGKVLIFLACVFGINALTDLPEYLRGFRCPKNTRDFSECLRENFEKTRNYFVNGIEELNVPPLDPFEIPFLAINRTLDNSLSIELIIKNLKLTGGKDAIIQKVKSDIKRMRGEMTLLIPKVHLSVDYDLKWSVAGNDIKSKGHLDGDFVNVALAAKGTMKLYVKDGVEYYAVDKFDAKLALGDGKIKIKADDPQQQEIVDFVTMMFNSNARGIIEELAPVAIQTSKDVVIELMNKILASAPAAAYLPDE